MNGDRTLPGDYILSKLDQDSGWEFTILKAFIEMDFPMLLIHRLSGGILEANQAALAFYGYTYDEITKMYIYDIDVTSRLEVIDVFSRMLKGQEKFELQHRIKNGSVHIINAKLKLLKMQNEEYILTYFDDITELKFKLESAYYERNRLVQLLNNLRSGIVYLDPYDRIIEINDRFKEIFKVGDEVYGKSINEVVADNGKMEEANRLSNIGFSGFKYEMNTVRKKSDGSLFDVNVQVVPIYIENKIVGVYGIYTPLKMNEVNPTLVDKNIKHADFGVSTELRTHERLSKINDLATKLAHEINTPLGISITGITYMTRILGEVMTAVDDNNISRKFLRDNLKDIENAMELLMNNLGYIKETMDLMKNISYELTYDRDEINLKEEIKSIIATMKDRLSKMKLPIEIKGPDNLNIRSSKTLISQMIKNIVKNAVDHGVDDWDLFKIEILLFKVDDQIEIHIKDNGVGMDTETLERIFEPYYSGTKLGKQHLGLGLSIVYNIVTFFMDGSVKVQSTLGEGTEFKISI